MHAARGRHNQPHKNALNVTKIIRSQCGCSGGVHAAACARAEKCKDHRIALALGGVVVPPRCAPTPQNDLKRTAFLLGMKLMLSGFSSSARAAMRARVARIGLHASGARDAVRCMGKAAESLDGLVVEAVQGAGRGNVAHH